MLTILMGLYSDWVFPADLKSLLDDNCKLHVYMHVINFLINFSCVHIFLSCFVTVKFNIRGLAELFVQ